MKLDLQLYRGYVNEGELIVFGHVFKSWAPDKYQVDRKGFKHAFSVLHMFIISPLKDVEVRLKFKNLDITTLTMQDGYFRFTVPFTDSLESGWHKYEVSCKPEEATYGIVEKADLLKPFESELSIISDIDDTFLISHSGNLFKKLYVMLARNVNKRKTFEDVVKHYDALSNSGHKAEGQSNSFFYVSSSEWNLYDFIVQFTKLQRLPKAVIKLKDIKTGISDFLTTGGGDHDHKFVKIKDIISFYPKQQYVLLGDDSQQDAFIYERICKTFPKNIKAVYLRQTRRSKKVKVQEALSKMERLQVATCYFKKSNQAISHSKEVGIIKT
ncbi:App1 family protein [Leeuwenhoekiella sp. MAR_2009_132]|uniref:App1 family protein n=1 Tax=Leeuwenhoekiella sp. MAR_2009_132 TaxID=1392489 RepID=UPI00048B51D5|nr:App1 family protein [Leeuwenhoekiella sp. MAR_2009_132]